jgi:hypothetical protein
VEDDMSKPGPQPDADMTVEQEARSVETLERMRRKTVATDQAWWAVEEARLRAERIAADLRDGDRYRAKVREIEEERR